MLDYGRPGVNKLVAHNHSGGLAVGKYEGGLVGGMGRSKRRGLRASHQCLADVQRSLGTRVVSTKFWTLKAIL